jgi:hypothetical protein
VVKKIQSLEEANAMLRINAHGLFAMYGILTVIFLLLVIIGDADEFALSMITFPVLALVTFAAYRYKRRLASSMLFLFFMYSLLLEVAIVILGEAHWTTLAMDILYAHFSFGVLRATFAYNKLLQRSNPPR